MALQTAYMKTTSLPRLRKHFVETEIAFIYVVTPGHCYLQ